VLRRAGALWEEVNAAPNVADVNWGWDDREGRHCFEPETGCLTAGRVDPVVEFPQTAGWQSVMGGQVYRGACFPDLAGTYFYSDHFAGQLWAFELVDSVATNNRQIPGVAIQFVTSIHADAIGEMYVSVNNGTVKRIVVR
jgi:hypothetical protein